MTSFGPYTADRAILQGPSSTMWSASSEKARKGPDVAVKEFTPLADFMAPERVERDLGEFVTRAETQRRVADAGSHWAPILLVERRPKSAFYVTRLYPMTGQRLIEGRVKLSGAGLSTIIESVVRGLIELRDAAGQPHGNLKPGNILIEQPHDPAAGAVVLTDPVDARRIDPERGWNDDLAGVGSLIFELVLLRRLLGPGSIPVATSPEWTHLGRNGERWRTLCNELLDSARPGGGRTLESLLDEVVALRESRSGSRRGLLVGALLVVVLGIAGGVTWYLNRPAPAPPPDVVELLRPLHRLHSIWLSTGTVSVPPELRAHLGGAFSLLDGTVDRLKRTFGDDLGLYLDLPLSDLEALEPGPREVLKSLASGSEMQTLVADAREFEAAIVREAMSHPARQAVTVAAETYRERGWTSIADALTNAVSTYDESMKVLAGIAAGEVESPNFGPANEAAQRLRTAAVDVGQLDESWSRLDVVARQIEEEASRGMGAASPDRLLAAFPGYTVAVPRKDLSDKKPGEVALALDVLLRQEATPLLAAAQSRDDRFAFSVFARYAYDDPALAGFREWTSTQQTASYREAASGWTKQVLLERQYRAVTGQADPRIEVATTLAELRQAYLALSEADRSELATKARVTFDGVELDLDEKLVDRLDQALEASRRDLLCRANENEIAKTCDEIKRVAAAFRDQIRPAINSRDALATATLQRADSPALTLAWNERRKAFIAAITAKAGDAGAVDAILREASDVKKIIDRYAEEVSATLDAGSMPVEVGRFGEGLLRARREALLARLVTPTSNLPSSGEVSTQADVIAAKAELAAAAASSIPAYLAEVFAVRSALVAGRALEDEVDGRPLAARIAALRDNEWHDATSRDLADVERAATDLESIPSASVDALATLVVKTGELTFRAVNLAAWRQLGRTDWPEDAGHLDTEIIEFAPLVQASSAGEGVTAAERFARWRAFHAAANSDAAVQSVLDRLGRGNPTLATVEEVRASDDWAARANLAIADLRRFVDDPAADPKASGDDAVRAAVSAAINELDAVRTLPGANASALDALAAALTDVRDNAEPTMSAEDVFAKAGPGAREWAVASADMEGAWVTYASGGANLSFVRLSDPEARPLVYIGSTEVSVGALAAAASHAPGLLDVLRPVAAAEPKVAGYSTWTISGGSVVATGSIADLMTGQKDADRVAAVARGLQATTASPVNRLTQDSAEAIAEALGARLPTLDEHRQLRSRHGGGANIADQALAPFYDACWALRTAQQADTSAEWIVPPGLVAAGMPATLTSLASTNDGVAWYRDVDGGSARVTDVEGNVAECVSGQRNGRPIVQVVGGSAVSTMAPDDESVRFTASRSQFEDAGLRVAFEIGEGDMVSPTLFQTLRRLLGRQSYLRGG
ncbi:MAG: hypothetical protein KDA25_04195 [Phycisphaerales bacterium]|nr:hypothetical protein [Phycisphaerales bacterium]